MISRHACGTPDGGQPPLQPCPTPQNPTLLFPVGVIAEMCSRIPVKFAGVMPLTSESGMVLSPPTRFASGLLKALLDGTAV